jgi:hypothetical protein
LAAVGPVLSVSAWLFARRGIEVGQRRGLFASAMTRGALAAISGLLVWLATLYVMELTATGALSW